MSIARVLSSALACRPVAVAASVIFAAACTYSGCSDVGLSLNAPDTRLKSPRLRATTWLCAGSTVAGWSWARGSTIVTVERSAPAKMWAESSFEKSTMASTVPMPTKNVRSPAIADGTYFTSFSMSTSTSNDPFAARYSWRSCRRVRTTGGVRSTVTVLSGCLNAVTATMPAVTIAATTTTRVAIVVRMV